MKYSRKLNKGIRYRSKIYTFGGSKQSSKVEVVDIEDWNWKELDVSFEEFTGIKTINQFSHSQPPIYIHEANRPNYVDK